MGDVATFTIKNLGPIRSGSFQLRPLTIFIGPNNSGKTYAALAAYSVCKGIAQGAGSTIPPGQTSDGWTGGKTHTTLILRSDASRNHAVKVQELPGEEMARLRFVLDVAKDVVQKNVLDSFRHSFGTSALGDLVRDGVARRRAMLSVSGPESAQPFIQIQHGRSSSTDEITPPDWQSLHFTARPTSYTFEDDHESLAVTSLISPWTADEMWSAFFNQSMLPRGKT